jgi:hypothetical protein
LDYNNVKSTKVKKLYSYNKIGRKEECMKEKRRSL